MQNENQLQDVRYRWDRKVLNTYWSVLSVLFLLTLINLSITPQDIMYMIKIYVIFQNVIILVLLVLTELLIRKIHKYSDYIIVTVGVLYMSFVIHMNAHLDIILIAIFIPLIISFLYYKKSIIVYTGILSIIFVFLLFFFNETIYELTSVAELYSMAVMTVGGVFGGIIIINRGKEMLDTLKESIDSRNDLIKKSIEMTNLSKTDPLTQLHNHGSFHDYLEQAIELKSKKMLNHLFLAIIDIDNFKQVNDTYGHATGDVILTKVSQILKENIDSKDFAARYGGEEFAIILGEKNLYDVLNVCNNIRKQIESTTFKELGDNNITISIGLKDCLVHESKESLFEKADAALYYSKRNGKNQVILYNPDLGLNKKENAR